MAHDPRNMSHLLQMRGLKPRFGATVPNCLKSHLLQMRGLKPTQMATEILGDIVASFTDAWIETFGIDKDKPANGVASFTDAWIETF